MKVRIASIIGVLGLAATAHAAGAVAELDAASFSAAIAKTPLTLVKFFAPWCGHCKTLAPELEAAAKELSADKAAIAKVNCDDDANKELCASFNVRGYPTLRLFRGSAENSTEYPPEGGKSLKQRQWRTAAVIADYLQRVSGPASKEITEAELAGLGAAAKKAGEIRVVGIPSAAGFDAAEFAAFADAAKSELSSMTLPASASVKGGASALVYNIGDAEKLEFTGTMTKDALWDFVAQNSVPLVAELSGENFAFYYQSGKPLAYLFVEGAEQTQAMVEAVRPVAEAHKGKIFFVHVDAALYHEHAGTLNLPKDKWPAFAIGVYSEKSVSKYPLLLDDPSKLSTKAMQDFAAKFAAGELKPSVKSEKAPEDNSGPVKVVTANTMQELVFDADKDVLLELYAPWCGHCKALAPDYARLGDIYAGAEGVVIAKFDGDANDVPQVVVREGEAPATPFTIEGFPTIMLVKAGTNEVVAYNKKGRSLDDLREFIEENAVNKGQFDADAKSGGATADADEDDDEDDEGDDDDYEEDHEEL